VRRDDGSGRGEILRNALRFRVPAPDEDGGDARLLRSDDVGRVAVPDHPSNRRVAGDLERVAVRLWMWFLVSDDGGTDDVLGQRCETNLREIGFEFRDVVRQDEVPPPAVPCLGQTGHHGIQHIRGSGNRSA
jgi:hypothetical protein